MMESFGYTKYKKTPGNILNSLAAAFKQKKDHEKFAAGVGVKG